MARDLGSAPTGSSASPAVHQFVPVLADCGYLSVENVRPLGRPRNAEGQGRGDAEQQSERTRTCV